MNSSSLLCSARYSQVRYGVSLTVCALHAVEGFGDGVWDGVSIGTAGNRLLRALKS
jgi:hypothetical protein